MPTQLYSTRVDEHLTRYRALKQGRVNFDTEWQDIVNLLLPGADDITELRYEGETRTDKLFDTTGIQALHTLAANIQGAVTNPAIEWFRMKFRHEGLNEQQAVKDWLAEVNTVMLGAYNASNFYQAMHSFYLTLAGFGTAAMFVGARDVFSGGDPGGLHLRFKPLSTGAYCIAENADGIVDTLYHEDWVTPRQAYQKWGDDISNQLNELLTDPQKRDTPVKILQCVYPRPDRSPNRAGATNMPWAHLVIECDTQHLIRESGFEEFPFMVVRWETLGRTPWGFGPGHIALPDVRVMNRLRMMNLEMLELWVKPPFEVLREGVHGGVSLDPLSMNMVNVPNTYRPMTVDGRPDLVQLNQEDLRKSIKDCFYADVLTGLPEPDASKMTAFEVAQRVELMQRLMGPAFTRMTTEGLDQLADRVFGMHLRASDMSQALGYGGLLPPMPQAVMQAAMSQQGQLDVEYVGPLARSQRSMDLRATAEVYTLANQMVLTTQDLGILDTLDHEKILRHAAEVSGLPVHLIRDVYDVMRMREARQQQQMAMMQAESTRMDMESMGKVAPLIAATRPQYAQAA